MSKTVEHLDIYPNYSLKIEQAGWGKKLKTLLLPQHLLTQISFELHMTWVRLTSGNVPKKYANSKELLVNLGAGVQGKQGWINVDAYAIPGINCIYDCRKKLPFPDNSVRGIFCEHFLEHIDYTEEVPYFLSECYRVLEPGGVIRLIVPDAGRYLKAYCKDSWEELQALRPLDSEGTDFYLKCKYHTKMELINNVFRHGEEHRYAYDYETLEFLLIKYGFSSVQQQEFGKSLKDYLCLDRQERTSESLYVEAVK